jgi:hypothetical protein
VTRIGGRNLPGPLTPREVRECRLLPFQIIERWGYRSNRHGAPNCPPIEQMPEQMRSEYVAAQRWIDESSQEGTLLEDYPQLTAGAGPFEDCISADGLTVHDWQM